MKARATLVALLGAVALVAAGLVATASPASALTSSLQEVTNFGANPTGLRMFEYVPATVSARPAIVVVLHFCTGSGPTMFNNTRYAALADQFGYIAIYPSATRSGQCFDVNTPQSLTHGGGSDPQAIMSMVNFVEQHNNADPNRVFATGLSSGAMMTNVLLGAYPDVFKAGSAYAGVPFGCFAGTQSFNNTCANGQITKTPQQWGDLVRAADPGFSGPRPRMQLWHGTADQTLNFVNFGEEIKQWTNVFGLSQTPSTTDSPQSGWTHTTYRSSAGVVVVEATSEQGVTHNIPIQESSTIHFFGLDGGATPTPTPTATTSPRPTPTATPTPTPTATPTGGAVTATPVVSSNGPFFNDEEVKLANASPLTSLTVTIVIQRTSGVSFSSQFNTVGGSVLQANSSTASAITYTFTLASGQTLGAGTAWTFAAQAGGNGTTHPTTGDTFTVTSSSGTTSGHF
jgi:poly(hydroxyalkanoate) depolymerase family esterase